MNQNKIPKQQSDLLLPNETIKKSHTTHFEKARAEDRIHQNVVINDGRR